MAEAKVNVWQKVSRNQKRNRNPVFLGEKIHFSGLHYKRFGIIIYNH
jgi:hypothetical protein